MIQSNSNKSNKTLNLKKWIDATNDEIKPMKDNKVWNLVKLPEVAKSIGCKCIIKNNRDSKGNI